MIEVCQQDTIDPMLVPETVDPNAPETSPTDHVLNRGDIIGDYIVWKRLSQGSQATTYLCQKDEGRFVLKVFRPGAAPNGISATLAQEANTHHIAPLLDRGHIRGQFWEVYPYYSGGTLENVVLNRRCTPRLVERVLLPCMVDALAFLGSLGLIHADVKPANIFFTPKLDEAILGDLGVALSYVPEGRKVEFRGSPEYAPRGSIAGDVITLTRGYDWGSLGLLLCYAYAGEQPLDGVDPRLREYEFMNFVVPSKVPRRARDLVMTLACTPGGPENGERLCRSYLRLRGVDFFSNSDSAAPARKGQEPIGLEFGIVSGRLLVAHDYSELLDLCEEYPDVARYLLDSSNLTFFLRLHKDGEKICARYIDSWRTAEIPVRHFKLCMALRILSGRIGLSRLCFDGHIWESPLDLLNAAIEGDAAASMFLKSNLFLEYLAIAGMEEGARLQVRKALRSAPNTRDAARLLRALFMPSDCDGLRVGSKMVNDIESLVNALSETTIEVVSSVVEDPSTRPWLYRRGFEAIYKEVDSIHE